MQKKKKSHLAVKVITCIIYTPLFTVIYAVFLLIRLLLLLPGFAFTLPALSFALPDFLYVILVQTSHVGGFFSGVHFHWPMSF